MKTLNILKYVFTLIGAGMLVAAVMSYSSTVSFIERATEATGTVIDLERSRSSDSTTYYPWSGDRVPVALRLKSAVVQSR